MLYNIKATNFEMTSDIRSYLDTRLASLDKHVAKDDDSVRCDVEVARTTGHHHSGEIFKVEINVSIGKFLFRAEATGESINSAIDEVQDEINKQLSRHKERQSTLFRRGGEKIKNFLRFGRD